MEGDFYFRLPKPQIIRAATGPAHTERNPTASGDMGANPHPHCAAGPVKVVAMRVVAVVAYLGMAALFHRSFTAAHT